MCAALAVVGIAALDDYGIAGNEIQYRKISIANANYIATGDLSYLSQPFDIANRYYGVALDMPLLLLERALELQDTRDIYLTRHLIIHLFFIVGGFACGMLAYRMLGSRWIALLAMLMFLLHPRLYAHSFINVKDIPFAALLLVSLWLAHRAFRRDTLGAFLMCGIVAGLAISLRPFGLMLPPILIAMRALDWWQAGRRERQRILMTSAAFMAAAAGTAYISYPYYWENPLRFVEGVSVVSQHPIIIKNLFMGEIYRSDETPWNYIPVWFAITSPPVALSLGVLGGAAVLWQGAAHPIAALRDREIRFRILLLGCFTLPVAVAIILQSNIYHGWRHMYFLWGPFCLLAAIGLRALSSGGAVTDVAKGVSARLPHWILRGGMRQALAFGAAGFGLITTLTAMIALHPHQQVYFNTLTDTNTPGALGERYDTDYYRLAHRQMLERLLASYPDDTLRVLAESQSRQILTQNDRERIVEARNLNSADYYIPYIGRRNVPNDPMLHRVEAYGSVIAYILAPNNAAAYRAAYDDVAANGTLVARSDFDIYIYNGALHYLSANCDPLTANGIDLRVFLRIIPVDRADLPSDMLERGFENADFRFNADAAFFDGKCINIRRLPDYPIARITTGQKGAARGGDEWRADIDLAAHAAAQELYGGIAAGDYGQPVALADFDVYLRGDGLAYLKEPCAAGDTDARFFLHIIPVNPADLPADGREYGFANLDFQFADHGADIGGKCLVERELPDYAIERISTGQFVSGEGNLWRVEFPAAR